MKSKTKMHMIFILENTYVYFSCSDNRKGTQPYRKDIGAYEIINDLKEKFKPTSTEIIIGV